MEGTVFGSYGDFIRYASLSLDGAGATSYGPFHLTLGALFIADRASLLERNTYFFVQQHKVIAGDPLPAGYRCDWTSRHLLAAAKHGHDLQAVTSDGVFPALLLRDGHAG